MVDEIVTGYFISRPAFAGAIGLGSYYGHKVYFPAFN